MTHRWVVTLVTLSVALLSMACVGAQPASVAPMAGDTPVPGGTFNVSTTSDPFDYDMSHSGSTGINATFPKLGYSYLMRLKTGPDIGYSQRIIEPYLAERWEVSPDAKTFTFHLRKGVKFANTAPVNGRELTASDVKWSFEYMGRTGAFKGVTGGQFGWMFEGLDGITTPDPYTVTVKFKESFAPFLYYASSSDNVIMPREIYDQDKHFKDRVVGTGPFQPDFGASQKGASWILKRNPTYFEDGKPYLDQVKIFILPDTATQQAAYQTKQIDYVTATDARAGEEIMKSVPNSNVAKDSNINVRLVLTMDIPPFDNPKVRKAFSLALDRDEAIRALEGGEGQWALQGTSFFDDLFTEAEIKSFVKYDPVEAKRLLAEAGFPNGLNVDINFANSTATVTRLELIQAQLKKAGINMTLKPMPAEEYNALKRNRTFQMHVLGEPGAIDLDAWWQLIASPNGSFNYGGMNDPKINELLDAERKETNPEKRNEIFRQMIRYANETALMIPSWRGVRSTFMHPYVKGWHHQMDYRLIGSVWNTWLAK